MSGEPSVDERNTLLARLGVLEGALYDLEQEQSFTLGQTGVHIGAARIDYLRRSWAAEGERIRAEMAQIRQLLGTTEGTANG